RRRNRALQVETEVEHIGEYLRQRNRLSRPSRSAEQETQFAALEHHDGVERMRRPLAWGSAVGVTGDLRKSEQPVVEDDAGGAIRDAAAERGKDALHNGHAVALAVGNREHGGAQSARRVSDAGRLAVERRSQVSDHAGTKRVGEPTS